MSKKLIVGRRDLPGCLEVDLYARFRRNLREDQVFTVPVEMIKGRSKRIAEVPLRCAGTWYPGGKITYAMPAENPYVLWGKKEGGTRHWAEHVAVANRLDVPSSGWEIVGEENGYPSFQVADAAIHTIVEERKRRDS